MSHLTDGVHLYENLGSVKNFRLAGGSWLTVRDCRTDTVRTMCQPEQALCEPVRIRPAASPTTPTLRDRLRCSYVK